MRATAEAALNAAWAASAAPDALRFAAALRRVAPVQEALLLGLLRRHAPTAFGRRHGFGAIGSVAEFRARVPVSAWEDYRDDLEAVQRGEPARLAAGPVERLCPTSGSTGGAKLVPYTAELRRQFLRAVNAWVFGLFARFPAAARGRAYWSLSPPMSGLPAAHPGGPPVGFEDDGAYLGGLGRRVFDRLQVAPRWLAAVPDPASFRYATLRFLLAAGDLSLVSVWHPGFLGALLDAVPAWAGELLADIRAGTLRPPSPLPPHVAQGLGRALRPDAARAARLAPLLGAAAIPWTEVWPQLALVSCWEDAAAGPGAAALRELLPGVRVEGKGLLATEGVVSIPWGAERVPALAATSHFFEFVERDPGGGGSDGAVRLAAEVDRGGVYAVLLTTGGGLFRYRIGDLVRVEGFAGRCPLLRFVGREGGVSDLTGEKLHEAHVGDVLGAVAAAWGLAPRFSMLAPEPGGGPAGPPGYVWFLETGAPVAGRCGQLAREIDAALGQNPHYRHSRRMNQLGPPRIFLLRAGAASDYLEARRASGLRTGDVKPAALDRAFGWTTRLRGAFPRGAGAP